MRIKSFFPTFDVVPINDINVGLRSGGYTSHNELISPQSVPLKTVVGLRRIHVVPFMEIMLLIEYIRFLDQFGLRLLTEHSINYLLGLMALTADDGMPRLLQVMDIVAISPRSISGCDYYVYVFQSLGRRELSLCVPNDGTIERKFSTNFASLAEEIV